MLGIRVVGRIWGYDLMAMTGGQRAGVKKRQIELGSPGGPVVNSKETNLIHILCQLH